MLARLLIDLGFRIVVRPDDSFEPIEVTAGGYRFVIFPPYKSSIRPADRDFTEGVPIVDVAHALPPADPQPTPVRLDDGPATAADALRVDISGEALTRKPGTGQIKQDEPAISLAFDIVNGLLERLRLVAGAPFVRPVVQEQVYWYLRYLEDDGSEFEHDPSLVRGRAQAHWEAPGMPLVRPDRVWLVLRELSDSYVVPSWETLFLDARLLLESKGLSPEVGPGIVLAASAIETRIGNLLQLSAEQVGGEALALWAWLTGRSEWWREPSLSEKLSDVLAALTGRSLKDNAGLWEAFRNLYEARNKYVHEGVARIGGQPVTFEKALELVGKVRSILDWLEEDSPEETRRPQVEGTHTFELFVPFATPLQDSSQQDQ